MIDRGDGRVRDVQAHTNTDQRSTHTALATLTDYIQQWYKCKTDRKTISKTGYA